MTLETDCWLDLSACLEALPEPELPLVQGLLAAAAAYADARVRWQLAAPDERAAMEAGRSRAHDGFIDAANALSRACGRHGLSQQWRAAWGEARAGEPRRRIGDFACHIAWQLALKAR